MSPTSYQTAPSRIILRRSPYPANGVHMRFSNRYVNTFFQKMRFTNRNQRFVALRTRFGKAKTSRSRATRVSGKISRACDKCSPSDIYR